MPDNKQKNTTGVGIMLMMACTLCFAGMDGLSKFLISDYSASQILFIRYFVFLLMIIAMIKPKNIILTLKVRSPMFQSFRALTLVIEQVTFILGVSYLALGDMHVLMAATPLVVAGLSVPLLGEKVGIRRWSALLVGLCGVVLVLQPEGDLFRPAAFFALASVILFALYQIMTRQVSKTDDQRSTILYTAIVGTIGFGITAPFGWVTPPLSDWWLFAVLAILGSGAHLMLIKALAYAPAAVLQPFFYLTLAWALVVGYFFFGSVPAPITIGGAVIILSAGLYTLHRERINLKASKSE